MEPLVTDEIIEEIHAIRLEHAASLGFDMERILADLKKSEQLRTEQGWPLVRKQETTTPNTAFQKIRFAHY